MMRLSIFLASSTQARRKLALILNFKGAIFK